MESAMFLFFDNILVPDEIYVGQVPIGNVTPVAAGKYELLLIKKSF